MTVRTYHRAASALLALLLLSILFCLPAHAADFSDLDGHWAAPDMTAAAEKGWLTGFEDGTMRPDAPITGAQAAALLCRMLNVPVEAQAGESWYAPAASAARELGFLPAGTDLTAPLERREAFLMLAEAFQTFGAQADAGILSAFSDAGSLSSAESLRVAGLVERGCVQGYNGSLGLSESLTRGQFAAVLTRLMAQGELCSETHVSGWEGNTLWLTGQGGALRLDNVQADTVVIRCRRADSLRLNGCTIGKLVLAQENGLSLTPRGVQCLQAGPGAGTVTINGDVTALELTGSRTVSLRAGADNCTVAASGCNLTVSGRLKSLTVTGEDNTVTVSGTVTHAGIYGARTALTGYGQVKEIYLRATGCDISRRFSNLTDETDYGICGVQAQLTHPDLLPAGETLEVSALLTGAEAGLTCTAVWSIDGQVIDSRDVTLTGDDCFTIRHDYLYKRDMPLESAVSFSLSYVTEYGDRQTVSAQYVQILENYPDDYLFPMDPERILALVTTEYQGDYTLEWAQSHDYEPFEKEIWVNTKGYESSSPYLIWINQSCQRVNIFEGSQGQWTLIRSCIVGCGADRTATPRGVFKTTWNQPGWFTASYDVRPVVRFYGGGYAFHSRLYYPGTNTLSDPGIGYPISHGCIRMYDEDIQWIYDNVPSGTTVVSY